MSVGDIDGDGELEVIIATMGGAVWALSARDGKVRSGELGLDLVGLRVGEKNS